MKGKARLRAFVTPLSRSLIISLTLIQPPPGVIFIYIFNKGALNMSKWTNAGNERKFLIRYPDINRLMLCALKSLNYTDYLVDEDEASSSRVRLKTPMGK